MSSTARGLGRRPPTDWKHVDRFPITATTVPTQPVPVVVGTNWYTAFDSPQKVGNAYWIARDGNLGTVRGGHCYCLQAHGITDPLSWWRFYDQGDEGACVGFGCSRMMSLLNRKRYDAPWLYHEAQKVDEWPGEDYDGTSVRAGLDVLRTEGAVAVSRGRDRPVSRQEGISANRWATSVDDVLAALGTPNADHVVLRNSWGVAFPHTVRMPCEVLERLLSEDGEAGIPTDR